MKPSGILLGTFSLYLAWGAQPSYSGENLAALPPPEALLKSALIVGASVSAGFDPVSTKRGDYTKALPSPGMRLAQRYGGRSSSFTQLGGKSVDAWSKVTPEALTQATSFIGVDFLFWDSTVRGDACENAKEHAHTIISTLDERKIPWMMGLIPNVTGKSRYVNSQPCRDRLNELLLLKCSANVNCRLLDLPRILRDIEQGRGLNILGKFYLPEEIQPDGLHLSAIGAEFLADVMEMAVLGDHSSPYVLFGSDDSYFRDSRGDLHWWRDWIAEDRILATSPATPRCASDKTERRSKRIAPL